MFDDCTVRDSPWHAADHDRRAMLYAAYRTPWDCFLTKRDVLVSSLSPESHLKIGKAITTITRDVPNLLREPPTKSVYSPDVVLDDRVFSHMKIEGIRPYSYALAAARFAFQIHFSEPHFRIKYVTRTSDRSISVRWTLHGAHRPSVFHGLIAYSIPRLSSRLEDYDSFSEPLFEGVFTYDFNAEGQVTRHVIDNVAHTGGEQQGITSRVKLRKPAITMFSQL